jgi:hypothetical protein
MADNYIQDAYGNYVSDPGYQRAQDLNNPRAPASNGLLNNGNSFGSSNIGLGHTNPLMNAWGTFSGRNDFRAPEKVFNPIAWYDPKPSQEIRNQQVGRGSPTAYYQGQMEGSLPSLAENQMQQGIAQSNRQGMQSAAGARGIDRAAAFRQAQNNSAQLNATGAIAGGQQRLQEQQMGAAGAAQNLQNVRQQDVGEQLGLIGGQNQAQSNLNQQYKINADITGANAGRQQSATKDIVSSIGAVLKSDVRAKENIHPVGFLESVGAPSAPVVPSQDAWSNEPPPAAQEKSSNEPPPAAQEKSSSGPDPSQIISMVSDERSKENLAGIHGYQFDYKDQDAHQMATEAARKAYVQAFTDAKQPREGVMAQDLASNPHARETVVQDPNGRLAIDMKRALGFTLANQASLNDRLSKLEGGRVA